MHGFLKIEGLLVETVLQAKRCCILACNTHQHRMWNLASFSSSVNNELHNRIFFFFLGIDLASTYLIVTECIIMLCILLFNQSVHVLVTHTPMTHLIFINYCVASWISKWLLDLSNNPGHNLCSNQSLRFINLIGWYG